MTTFSLLVVLATSAFLIGLFVASVIVPDRVARFLAGFASSARAHVIEQCLRIIAGSGLAWYAPFAAYPWFMRGFGWILIVTSAVLLVLPWRWHQRFAGWAVPFAIRRLRLYTTGALLLGAFIIYCVVAGTPPGSA